MGNKKNSCKNRFCPIYSWKKARKEALSLSVMMEYLKEELTKEQYKNAKLLENSKQLVLEKNI